MKRSRAALYAAAFAGLAATTAIVVGSIATPTVAPLLLAAAAVATLAGAPGILHRRVWPLALLLFPLGAYLLARAQVPAPVDVHGAGGQLAFYLEQLRAGGRAYARDVFPLEVAAKADVRLVLSLVMYAAVWLAAFLALSLRRPLPAIVLLLVLLGFGFTTDAAARNVWATLAFLLLAGSMLVLARSLQREHWRSSDVAAGAITATIAAVLALSIVGATSVEAGRPLRDWRTWGGGRQRAPPLQLDAELPRPPRSRRRRTRHARALGGRLVLAGQRALPLRRRELVGRRSQDPPV